MNDDISSDLPPIEQWWPFLSIPSKHALRDNPGAAVPSEVLDDIERATGLRPAEGTRLSEDDAQFIQTQTDPVD